MNKGLLATVGVVLIGGVAVVYWRMTPAQDDPMRPIVSTAMHGADAAAPPRPADEIVVPKLSSPAQMGKIAFDENCAACHGPKASGTENGPPLIHRIYEPSHHADFAFVRAARQGVKAHHWRFGDMAPVEGVTDKQIEWITRYVREVQRANGIM
jgi:mono/diheme cytochrome c family protein